MKREEIVERLQKRFEEPLKSFEKRKIIIWQDSEAHFQEIVSSMDLSPVKILTVQLEESFQVKYRLEIEDPLSSYLLYVGYPKPSDSNNWLLDIWQYAEIFSADRVSLIMDELGTTDGEIRTYLDGNPSFFQKDSKTQQLMSFPHDPWDFSSLQIAMLCVAVGSKKLSILEVLKKIAKEEIEGSQASWEKIAHLGLEGIFWDVISQLYDLKPGQRTLSWLFQTILVTATLFQTGALPDSIIPDKWQAFRSKKENHAIEWIDSWVLHSQDQESYFQFAKIYEAKLGVTTFLKKCKAEQYCEIYTFLAVDEWLIGELKNRILKDFEVQPILLTYIGKRKHLPTYNQFREEYELFESAVQFFVHYSANQTIPKTTLVDFAKLYQEKLVWMDYWYRNYYEKLDSMEEADRYLEITDKLEKAYRNKYLEDLATAWNLPLTDELIPNHPNKETLHQKDFYTKVIHPFLARSDRDRIVVIVSDAFRYEASIDLEKICNETDRYKSTTKLMIGSIPTITHVGMASLLPRKSWSMDETGTIKIDGLDTASLAKRGEIIKKAQPDSIAYKLSDFLELGREKGRDEIAGKRLVYLYHNTIDAVGEDPASERKVFQAVRDTVEEIWKAVKFLVNHLNVTRILVTSDHGFLYNRTPLDESDKLFRADVPVLASNRRMILSTTKADCEGTYRYDMANLMDGPTPIYVYFPKGMLRFKLQGGGVNFVHGGLSPQEMFIPVVEIVAIKSAKEADRKEKARLILLNDGRRITNTVFHLKFFQSEKVTERITPCLYKLAFWSDKVEGIKLSNEKIIEVKSDSDNTEERTYAIQLLLLKECGSKPGQTIYLRMERDGEVEDLIPFMVNLSIVSEFDE